MCPWLNEATAGGALGGPVTVSITHTGKDNDDANCEFTHREGSVVMTLRIEVETMAAPAAAYRSFTARCTPDAQPLRAIGNQAIVCSLAGKKREISEQVIGRVRDRAFVVRVTSSTDSLERTTLRTKARRVAEQVAGFLF